MSVKIKYNAIFKWVLFILISASSFGLLAQSKSTVKKIIRSDFQQYFDQCQVSGAIAVYDNKRGTWILSDTTNTQSLALPASTFKIINMLIALETKTIKDEHSIVQWPGSTDTVKYGYRPNIYKNITVKEAFEVSAGWAFIEIAKKIDRSVYRKYLEACDYGNVDLSESGSDFWNFGSMGISPINQVEFLKKLYVGDLPFAKRNMDIVKRVMVSEKNDDYIIRSKTGWTMANQINTGWWVGYVEQKGDVYFFATRLIQDRKFNRPDFSACRKEITKKVLRDLNILP
ncbi:MAG: penicillin binding protein transpeptidase domain-containing protein [Sphingobacterium sp.]|jgi:beta-lactamase class D|uniref:penicillin-binding transpeptidase domain-containing protein n=1 Tax=unclassified Sphingobacterium TaxID=2609468 RepID=UPI00283DEF48|nr:penicillin-binding transpeptidase domain-containing protein [Sphingobacterium sp.]MDR3006984.1 penicillin binding protein transpeptidase domain-containing protein [Sphingobacterium sp.]